MYIYANQSVIPLAGLWTSWGNMNSFTIITQSSFGDLGKLHHRMPLILDNSSIFSYLDEGVDFDNSYQTLSDRLSYHRVSNMVNSVKIDTGDCIKSI